MFFFQIIEILNETFILTNAQSKTKHAIHHRFGQSTAASQYTNGR